MVAEVRAGASMRAVARAHDVSLSTVQWWCRRAGERPLDRVDWSDRAPIPGEIHRPAAWSGPKWIPAPRPSASRRFADVSPITSRSCAKLPTSFHVRPFATDREAMPLPSNRVFPDREILTPGLSTKMLN